jgi:hypothetical protein
MKENLQNVLALLTVLSLVFLVIGLFSPDLSLFWKTGESTRTTSSVLYSISFIGSFVLFGIASDQNRNNL